MATTADGRTPAHLWIIGILALLWNAFGCYDYLMTMTGNAAYLSQFPADALTYWEGLPSWTAGAWAFGVWGGLVGAILLLMRNRLAVWAFALSLIGAVLGLGYQMFVDPMPASLKEGMMGYMPWVIIAIAAFQLWYSWSEEKKGTIR
jgi:hypothetical protein